LNRQRASFQKRTSEEPNYYEMLGVAQDASIDDIKKKYKALVLKFHPDRENSALAKQAMVSINNAYEVLSDPQRRMSYDASLNEPPEMPQNENPQARRAGPGVVRISRKIQALVTAVLLISCIAGCQTEELQGGNKPASEEFVEANSHYFTAITHEALAALPLFIPGFGMAWGVLGGFTTGFVGRAVIMTVSLHANMSGPFLAYLVLAAAIKLVAYHIGMCRSLTLVISIRRRRFSKLDSTFTQGEIILAVLLSCLAGFVEHAVITTR